MRDFLQRARQRLRHALWPARLDRQLSDELRFHIESETAAKMAAGQDEASARRQALAELGGVQRWRDEVRDQRPGGRTELLLRDARLAARTLRRSPAYSIPVVATLALGVAALATIASLTSAVLLRPLPYRDPERLVALWERNIPRNRTRNVVSAIVFEAWRTRSRTLEGVSAFMPASEVWAGEGSTERVFGAEVSANVFELLGRRPALGPGFSREGPTGEVVLSHGFWTRRLGADSSIIGRAIRMSGRPLTVVGVMPNDFIPVEFGWLGDQEFWLPLIVGAEQRNWGRFLVVAGRLKSGATLDALGRELESLTLQLINERALAEGWSAHALPLAEEMTGSVKPALVSLAIASLLLIALVVVNGSLLTLAHMRQRGPDLALRAALGATRARLRREQFLTSGLLGGTGAMLGTLLAVFAIPILVQILPADLPRLATVRFDAIAAACVVAAGLIVTLVLALIPARASDAYGFAAHGTRLTARSRGRWLIVAEAALALVLAVLAGLTVRSFDRLRSVDVGFDRAGLHAVRLSLGAARPATPPVVVFTQLMEQLAAIPGVSAVGFTSVRPLGEGGAATSIAALGAGEAAGATGPVADVRLVDPGYFRTLQLRPLAGRLFTGREAPGTQARAIVNEAFVGTLWGGEPNAIGRRFELNMYDDQRPEVIAVVRDVRLLHPRQPARPTVYLSASQFPSAVFDVVVRSALPAGALLAAMRDVVDRTVPGAPIYNTTSLSALVASAMATERVTAFLLGFFALAAILLVAVGVYGVFAGEVARKRQEIGVRLALGETAQRLVQSMLVSALSLILGGVLLGTAASMLTTRVLRAMLYEVAPTDLLSHVAATALVLAAALAATLFPALQATRVDPVSALRAD